MPAEADPEMRHTIAGADVEFLVLYTGSMGAKQGLENVVHACEYLRGERGLRVVLAGDGPARPGIENAIARSGLTNVRTADLQPVDYFVRMLAAADLLLINQREDVVDSVVPSKLIHYMAAGRPILAAVNKASVAAQLINEAGSGIVVLPQEPTHLADAIRDLRREPDLRAKLARRGRDYAEQRYAKRVALQNWTDLVTELTSGQQS